MSAITPHTELKLLKCPLDNDNLNQLTFSSENEQFKFFNKLPSLDVDNFTYQRKDGIIRYPAHVDSILDYNYVMYRNDNYSDKWFYAFITKMEYINDNMTNISIQTDPYQTWQFNIEWKKSYVEREHVNDDSVGLHTIPEGLETGDYVCGSSSRIFEGVDTYIVVSVSDAPSEISPRLVKTYNGIFSGTEPFLFRDAQSATNFIRAMALDAKMDAIVSVYLAPQKLFTGQTLSWSIITVTRDGHSISFEVSRVPISSDSVVMQTSSSFSPLSTLNGYTPKNNKLKTYPYNYFYISNNCGTEVPFKYEDFINNTAVFKTAGCLTPSCSIRCVPIDYKKLDDSNSSTKFFHAGITVGKYPICSWSNDAYVNWLTSNSLNIGMKALGGITGIIGGAALIATGGGAMVGAGMIAGGIGMITDSAKEQYQHSLTPDQAQGNTNSGDVAFSSHKIEVSLFQMTLRSEYAKVIDDYFSMFGYKVNSMKVPNITGRKNWNYVKTLQANIEGDIPDEDMNEIKNIFNRGITLWHNPSTFLDYSQNNAIV